MDKFVLALLCALFLSPFNLSANDNVRKDTLHIGFYSNFKYDIVDIYINGTYVSTNTLFSGERGLAVVVEIPVLQLEQFDIQILFYERRSINIEYNPLWYNLDKLDVDWFVPAKLFTYRGKMEDGKYILCDLIDTADRTRSLLVRETMVDLEMHQSNELPIVD